MSKFLPIFKKKGKGKDEEGIQEPRKKVKGKEEEMLHETKKKRAKVAKVLKEVNPLSSATSTHSHDNKKKKPVKRKAPVPNAKEILGYDRERSKELYVDGTGTVREMPAELFVDETGTVREMPPELYVDEKGEVRECPGKQFTDMTLEDNMRDTGPSTTAIEGVVIPREAEDGTHNVEDNESVNTEDTADVTRVSEYSTLDIDIDKFINSGRCDEDYGLRNEEDVKTESDVYGGGTEDCDQEAYTRNLNEKDDDENCKSALNDGVQTTTSTSHPLVPSESVLGPECINNTYDAQVGEDSAILQGDLELTCHQESQVTERDVEQLYQEPKEANMKNINTEMGNLDIPNSSNHVSYEVKETIPNIPANIDEEENEGDIHICKEKGRGDHNKETREGKDKNEIDGKMEAEGEVGKDEEDVDNLCDQQSSKGEPSIPTSSQDSDDDFDSAQEDWEDDYNESRVESGVQQGNKSLQEQEAEIAQGVEKTIETTNVVLIDRQVGGEAEGVQVGGKSELVETLNEALMCGSGEEDGDQTSRGGQSSTSSVYVDAPSRENSEIQDLSSLAEDVSEGGAEDLESDNKTSGQHPKLTRKVSTASSDVFDEELDELLDEELDRLSEEEETQLRDTPPQDIEAEVEKRNSVSSTDDVVNKDQVDRAVIQSVKVISPETIMPKTDVDIKITDLVEPVREPEPVCNDKSVISKEPSVSQKDGGNQSSEVKSSTSLTVEDVQEQAKDSGYYSLPVSPAVARGSDPPPATCHQHPDDSFGDSEEEGMVTPPCEMTTDSTTTSIPSSEASTPTTETDSTHHGSVILESQVQESSTESETDVLHQVANGEQENVTQVKEESSPEKKESVAIEGESGLHGKQKSLQETVPENAAVSEKDKDSTPLTSGEKSGSGDNQKSLQLTMPKHTAAGTKDEVALSTRSGSSTPTPRHVRHKTSMSGGEEGAFSPDPVGDHFLRQAVCLSHEEAEARLAQRRAARAEARELRLRELEKQQHEQDNEDNKTPSASPYPDVSGGRGGGAGRTGGGRGAGVNCIAGTQFSSRRSSEDSTTDETLPTNVREMRSELKELDEKFRKAMITNAQLDNEKATLTFEVELMKDRYTELEETHTQLSKEHRKKCTEYEQLRKVSTKLQEEVKMLRALLQERDQLIQEYGLVVIGEEENGEDETKAEKEKKEEEDDVEDLSPRKIAVKKALISQEAAELISKGAAHGSLDVRLRKFGEEKNDLEDQVRRLKLELEEERSKNRRRENGLDYEKQKEQSKTVNEYKFRVQKAEAEVSTLQANVARLDALSTRYKCQSEELEKSEEELKMEKRKLQRELRDAQSRLEELETTNNHLIKRFDKLKNARSNLLKDLSQDPA
ncbi:hypothetical protein Pcinc_027445 [Petrolisthes cinctipes]|uniref:Leucine-rich repeat flightless-interacting protein 1 n=1 Tax=Petrolisthes cinctipes TaxID=88211 RepID=A0AAE1F601_PETCI|nr:hypothetical protein Pcinc_027445 [Petrolisthes cinctipes]